MLVTGVTEVSHLVSLVPQSWRSRDRLYRHSHSLLDLRPFPALSAHAFIGISTRDIASCERERRWFVLERPRRDTNGGSETEVTVTSKLQANAERNKEIEKRQKREEKAASFGGAVRGSVPEDELSGGGARHSEAESEGGRRPECPG